MRIEQVEKTMSFIYSHIMTDELMFLLYDDHILKFKDPKVTAGRFSSRVVRALTHPEIEELVKDEKAILVIFTPDE